MNRIVLTWCVAMSLAFVWVGYRTWGDQSSYDAPSVFALAGTAWKKGTVVRVKDGDTIVVDGLTIRLAGIDSPETSQPFGDSAAGYLARACAGKEVYLEILGEDRYRRQLATVYLLDRPASLNAEMIHAGMAWRYHAEKSDWMKSLEASARDRRAGLWSSESPIPPWDWRKGVRK